VADANGNEPGQWRALGERTVYEDAYVRLGQAEVEVPGGQRFWHDVIRLRRAALMVLLDDRDRVLMLWRHRFVPDRWGWELPGGLVETGEEPSAAAARELEEETGYRARDFEYMGSFQPMPSMADAERFMFIGTSPERVGEPTDLTEAARVEWVPLDSVARMIDEGEIWSASSLVALARVLLKRR